MGLKPSLRQSLRQLFTAGVVAADAMIGADSVRPSRNEPTNLTTFFFIDMSPHSIVVCFWTPHIPKSLLIATVDRDIHDLPRVMEVSYSEVCHWTNCGVNEITRFCRVLPNDIHPATVKRGTETGSAIARSVPAPAVPEVFSDTHIVLFLVIWRAHE
jgi:hypothetical protein